jgi:colicin import membrane protein
MTAAALPSSVLAPQPAGGWGAGAGLALAVHAALVAALTIGVDWQAHTPEVVAAELWASVPELAAPPAAAPPPAPTPAAVPAPARVPAPAPPPAVAARPPDIALERERQRERDRRRAEAQREAESRAERRAEREATAQRRATEARAQAEAKAAEERLARQREENLRRMLGQANATPGTGSAGSTSAPAGAPSAAYQGRVKAAILPNIVYTGSASARAVAEVEVTLAPGGTVVSRRLVKRSGYPDWDDAVLRAVDRTPRLPADSDGRVPPQLLISFRPGD